MRCLIRVLVRASLARVRARRGTDEIGCRIAVTSEVPDGMAAGAAAGGAALFSARGAAGLRTGLRPPGVSASRRVRARASFRLGGADCGRREECRCRPFRFPAVRGWRAGCLGPGRRSLSGRARPAGARTACRDYGLISRARLKHHLEVIECCWVDAQPQTWRLSAPRRPILYLAYLCNSDVTCPRP